MKYCVHFKVKFQKLEIKLCSNFMYSDHRLLGPDSSGPNKRTVPLSDFFPPGTIWNAEVCKFEAGGNDPIKRVVPLTNRHNMRVVLLTRCPNKREVHQPGVQISGWCYLRGVQISGWSLQPCVLISGWFH